MASPSVPANQSPHATVEAPAEAILDSRVLMAASDAGALKARQLKLDANAFDTDEFITKLLHFMGARPGGRGVRTRGQRGEDEDEEEEVNDDDRWVKVGRTLAHESRRIPAVDHMSVPKPFRLPRPEYLALTLLW